jgi:hypothetical protein
MSAVWYRTFFDEQRGALSQYAMEMFRGRGRGAVVLKEGDLMRAIADPDADVAFEYFAEAEGPLEPLAERARRYDPMRFMLVAVVREDGSVVAYPLRLAPATPGTQARPNKSLAATP